MARYGCEAKISEYRQLRASPQMFLRKPTKEQQNPGDIVQDPMNGGTRTITCEHCQLDATFYAEGMGFVPQNETRRQIDIYLGKHCQKRMAALKAATEC